MTTLASYIMTEEAPVQYAPENEIRIFGPPGTGKTTTLSGLIADIVKEHGSDSIAVTSFTRAAAAELVGRQNVPAERVKTLHAFGYAAIGGSRKLAEQHIALWNAEAKAKGRTRLMLSEDKARGDDDLGAGGKFESGEGDKDFAQYQILRARRTPRELWPPKIQYLDNHWTKFKSAHDFIDFGDMIEIPLRERIPMPGNPEYLILDEAQDFTAAEMELARFWGQGANKVYVALDDDQSLYYFKGAEPEACLDPPVPEDRKRVLAQSYRVPRAVQKYAQDWIEKLSRREYKEYHPRDEEGEVRFIVPDVHDGLRTGTYMVPETVVNDAERYLSDGKTVMFLATCSYMLNPLKAVLRNQGIPFHNPYRATRNDWNPLTPANGVASSERLLAFLRLNPDVHGANARVWNAEEYLLWIDALVATGVLKRGMRSEIEKYVEKIAHDPSLLTRELNVDETQLGRWMDDEALAHALDQDLAWFEAHLAGSKRDGMYFPLRIAESRGARALMERPKVTIGTVHSVKGGQADVVYLFPDVSMAATREPIDLDYREQLRKLPSAVREKIIHDERRKHADTLIRVFYVGMTRARESLVICPPAVLGAGNVGSHVQLPNPGLWS